jgi:hypothetical protein
MEEKMLVACCKRQLWNLCAEERQISVIIARLWGNTVILSLSTLCTLEFWYFNHSDKGDTVPRLVCCVCITLF